MSHMKKTTMCGPAHEALAGSCHYLEDELCEVLGYRIYGSPWRAKKGQWAFEPRQPEFCDWAFGLPRGEPLAQARPQNTLEGIMKRFGQRSLTTSTS